MSAPGGLPVCRQADGVLTYGRVLLVISRQLGDRLEARRILESSAGVSSASLIRMLDDGVPAPVAERAEQLTARRAAGEPLQHVVGHWGWRSLEVKMDRRALVPRPETEGLVDLALDLLPPPSGTGTTGGPVAVDCGTGSGVIALSLVAEHPAVEVFALDSSEAALSLAAENRALLPEAARRRVHLLEGDWYLALPRETAGRVDLVTANPPYLAESEWDALDPVVRDYDPPEALVAGPTGLEGVDAVVTGAVPWLAPHGSLLVEIAPHQAGSARAIARAAGYGEVDVVPDLAGRPRVLRARRARAQR